jgi:UDP-N-acetylmuramate dehydrogenase
VIVQSVSSLDSIDLKENVPLAPLTTLKIGGPARFFVRAKSDDEVVAAFEHARKSSLKVFVLGGGSNILVSDAGFDGLVIQVASKGTDFDGSQVMARAGEDWDAVVAMCVYRDLAGVECLSGIPGFVGGTPVQNVGAYGQDVSETITQVRCYDRSTGNIVELSNADCGFTYRKSIFNSVARERYVVLSVAFELRPGGEANIEYKDLRERFKDGLPTLAEVRNAVLEIRRSKSMVIDAGDPNSQSAGSFFKNPIVDAKRIDQIAANAGVESVPQFPATGGMVKLPAAWLIERSGFHKGFRLDHAGISTNHSLAIVNFGGASAAEIIALKDLIQKGVSEKFGILLEPEPVFVGF